MEMRDWWVDGHYISATTEDAARAEAHDIYGHEPEEARPWTQADQDELDRATTTEEA